MKILTTVLVLLLLTGCGSGRFIRQYSADLRVQSEAENEGGFTYIPTDPFPVIVSHQASCKSGNATATFNLLDALPDNSVRMLVESFDGKGGVTYGVSKNTAYADSYRVTVDYVNADTLSAKVLIRKRMLLSTVNDRRLEAVGRRPPEDFVAGTEEFDVIAIDPDVPYSEIQVAAAKNEDYKEYNIPIYVGVGLRVSAHVVANNAKLNVSGIGVIGAEAEVNNLSGSLVVQTLGINGKAIASALPIQSELNRTTAQNAIVAVGAIKALLYSAETIKSPRVVGIYLPLRGGKQLVNALISSLAQTRSPVRWKIPCPL